MNTSTAMRAFHGWKRQPNRNKPKPNKPSDPAPQDGERKKPLQGRQLRAPIMDFPGTAAVLSNIKTAVPYALNKGVTTTRWHGGFRREPPWSTLTADKFRRYFTTVKKSPVNEQAPSGSRCENCHSVSEYWSFCARIAFCCPGAFSYLWSRNIGSAWPELYPWCRSPPLHSDLPKNLNGGKADGSYYQL